LKSLKGRMNEVKDLQYLSFATSQNALNLAMVTRQGTHSLEPWQHPPSNFSEGWGQEKKEVFSPHQHPSGAY